MVREEDEAAKLQRSKDPKARQERLASCFMRHRERLRNLVVLRLSPRLRRRLDPSDVLQEVFLEASRRLDEYLEKARLPLYLWLRGLTGQRILWLHRFHVGTKARDPRREVLIDQELPESSAVAMAELLTAPGASPGDAAALAETRRQVRTALEGMEALDREVLALRHFEKLANGEIARILGIRAETASRRYFRALKRLEKVLGRSGGLEPEGAS